MKKKAPADLTRATVEQFDSLHGLLTTVIARELQRCLASGDSPPAALLAQARSLLADNSITVPAKSPRLDVLAEVMPDFSDDAPPKYTPKE